MYLYTQCGKKIISIISNAIKYNHTPSIIEIYKKK